MYYYAILGPKGRCYTVLECSEERTDFSDPYTIIDSRDDKYLGAVFLNEQWQFPPTENHFWNGDEWVEATPPETI